MSNFFDTVRSLQEGELHWHQMAPQFSNFAHDASRVASGRQGHFDAAGEHGRAGFAHEKAAASHPEGSFARKYHSQMAQHHYGMEKLHGAESKEHKA
jgi:hypothetical protein